MTDADVISLAALASGFDHHAIRGCHDRRADRSAVVDAVMRLETMQNRMPAALRELRRDAREPQRRAEELLAQRGAFAAVVSGAAVGGFLPEGLEGLAALRETCGQDRTVTDGVAADELFLHHQAERVAA